jgi:outer membrane protein
VRAPHVHPGGIFVSTTTSFAGLIALTLAVSVPAAAQTKSKAPEPSLEHVRELMQQAQERLNAPAQTPSPARAAQAGPKVDLTVDEAVARALERNVTLASQRLTPQTFDYQIAGLWANYRPVVNSTLSSQTATQLGRQTIDGGSKTNLDTAQWNGGVSQNMRWYGGNYQLNFTNNRITTTQNNALLNPSFASVLQAQYTQPILQNLKIDLNRANILTTQISQDISQLDLKATTASITAQVRNAYWDFVFAGLNVENQRASLDLASKLVADNRARVEIGTLAPIDIVQAQAEEATRRQNVVTAEATLENAELALKVLIVSGTEDPLWAASLNPTDRPTPGTEAIDVEGAIRNALGQRTDLQTAKKNIDSANVTLKSLNNQTLPTLNAVGQFIFRGQGGLSTDPGVPPSNWWDALSNVGRIDAPTWTFQLNFQYPLGTSQADANKARQRIIVQQEQTQVKATELQVATDVTAAAINIRSSLEAIRQAAAARELSEKRLEAAQSKLDVGMATNFEVVQAQRDLADARNAELRQQLNYRRAIVDFERVQVSPR